MPLESLSIPQIPLVIEESLDTASQWSVPYLKEEDWTLERVTALSPFQLDLLRKDIVKDLVTNGLLSITEILSWNTLEQVTQARTSIIRSFMIRVIGTDWSVPYFINENWRLSEILGLSEDQLAKLKLDIVYYCVSNFPIELRNILQFSPEQLAELKED